MKIGDDVRISSLKEGDVGIFLNHKTYRLRQFIITARYPTDRVGGCCSIYVSGHGNSTIYWDNENPEVKFIGKGKLECKIKVNL